MKYLLLILILPVISFAQDLPTPHQFLDAMEQSDYVTGQMNSNGENLAPWQSWRQVVYQSFQVDVIFNNWQEYAAFEKRLLDEDLMYFAVYGDVDGLNITERGYTAQIHSPGLQMPIVQKYHFHSPGFALDPTVEQPYFGWYWRAINPRFAMAAKQMEDGRLHISMARFVRQNF